MVVCLCCRMCLTICRLLVISLSKVRGLRLLCQRSLRGTLKLQLTTATAVTSQASQPWLPVHNWEKSLNLRYKHTHAHTHTHTPHVPKQPCLSGNGKSLSACIVLFILSFLSGADLFIILHTSVCSSAHGASCLSCNCSSIISGDESQGLMGPLSPCTVAPDSTF